MKDIRTKLITAILGSTFAAGLFTAIPWIGSAVHFVCHLFGVEHPF